MAAGPPAQRGNRKDKPSCQHPDPTEFKIHRQKQGQTGPGTRNGETGWLVLRHGRVDVTAFFWGQQRDPSYWTPTGPPDGSVL